MRWGVAGRSRDLGGVLSIGKLTAGGRSERYYTQAVAKGREDYYAGHGEAPGHWVGSGWGTSETDREVTESELRGLLEGRHPRSDARLRRRRSAHGVMGFDLTFSAPKSVSILFAVGDGAVARAVRDAHDAAVMDALGYLERAACCSRRGVNGRREVQGRGFLAAAFRHRTSRAGDPQLHTHAVVANATQADDGKWGALDGRLLYRQAKTAGYLYQSALRAQLCERLAVCWGPVRNGSAEIDGVPRALIDHFSRRRAEVTQLMADRGERSATAAQVATLHSRQPKGYSVPVDRLREQWCARAAEHGFGQAELADVLERNHTSPVDEVALDRIATELAGARGVTRETSAFDRRAVLQEWAARHRNGASVRRIEDLADRWLHQPDVIQLEDGRDPRYSTREMLDIEQRLIRSALTRQRSGAGRGTREAVDTAIALRPTIAAEQIDLVRRLVTSGDGVEVVRSAAGTGKTFALDAARAAWQRDGIAVRGCALSARAAIELHDQAAIASSTIARLRLDIRDGHGLPANSVLVVDEAGMVGTRDLAELIDHAQHTHSKVVLVGDDRQLPEIDAGGAFRALAERLGALELRDVRRQREAWDRRALAQLRDGDLSQWIDSYQQHGRIIAAPTANQVRERLVDDWWRATDSEPGSQMVMVALRCRDVRDLNDRARDRVRAAGRLGADEVQIAGRAFATGDDVITVRNDRRLGVANGTRATVTAVDPTTRSVRVAIGDQDLELPAQYLENEGLDHAYAMTAHRLQGATVDRTFVLGSDELYREWGYTALSRHRDSAHYYAIAEQAQPSLPGLQDHDPLRDELTADLARRRHKELASQIASRDEQEPARSEDDRFAGLLRTIPVPVQRRRLEQAALEAADQQLDAALSRLQETAGELAATSRLRRKTRGELERRQRSQLAAVDHWTRERIQLNARIDHATHLRREWLAEHGWELLATIDRDKKGIPTPDRADGESDRMQSDEFLLDRLIHGQPPERTDRAPRPRTPHALDSWDRAGVDPPEL
jgi:Ti-type conjugative transfer relaxase TraA